MTTHKEIEKRVIDFRKRSFALLKLQSALEGESMVEIIEKALEQYADESVKMMIDKKYGEWTERPKKTCGRKPKVNKQETTESEQIEQSPKTIETTESEQMEQSPKTIETTESEQIEQSPKTIETTESEQMEQSPKTIETIKSEKIEQSPKTIETTESDEEIEDEVLSCYM